MNASIASINPPPQTTIADALALLKVINDPSAARGWLESMDMQIDVLSFTQADINAKLADLTRREEALSVKSDQAAQAAAAAQALQADYDRKAAALKAALAG